MAKYLTEFIGTFFLLFSIGSGALVDPGWHPLVIGLTLMLMVYMGGSISGAHFNPAVTIACKFLGKVDSKDTIPYIVSQIFGGIAGISIAQVLTKSMGLSSGVPSAMPSSIYFPAIVAEFLFTFMLAAVIFNVAVTERTKGNSFYGFAIGGVVVVGAMIGGKISGGAYNPAVGISVAVNNLVSGYAMDIPLLMIHMLIPTIGALVAAIVFKTQEKSIA